MKTASICILLSPFFRGRISIVGALHTSLCFLSLYSATNTSSDHLNCMDEKTLMDASTESRSLFRCFLCLLLPYREEKE